MKIDVNAEGASVDATTEELGEVAGALGLEIQGGDQEKPYEELALDQGIKTATAEYTEPKVVGEAGAPVAGVGDKLTKWATAWATKNLDTSVEPTVNGVTDVEWNARNMPGYSQGATPPPPQPVRHTTGAIYDLINMGEMDEVADRIRNAELADYNVNDPSMPNFNTYDDEVLNVIAEISTQAKEAIATFKRGNKDGKMSNEQLRQLAKLVRSDPDFLRRVLDAPPGETLPPEEILAMRQTRALLLNDVWNRAENYDSHTPEERRAYDEAYALTTAMHTRLSAYLTEGGRGSQAMAADMGLPVSQGDQIFASMQQMQNGLDGSTVAHMIRSAQTPGQADQIQRATSPSAVKKTFDSIHEVFINGVLSGVKTHVVNTIGGWLKMGMHVADTAVAARMGTGDNLDPTQRIHVGEWKAQIAGLVSGWQESLKIAVGTFKSGEAYGGVSKMDMDEYQQKLSSSYWEINPEGRTGKALDSFGYMINFPTKQLMAATDAYNKKLAERMTLTQLAYRRANLLADQNDLTPDEASAIMQDLIVNPTEEMKVEAKDVGLDVTFQTELGDKMKKVQAVAQMPFARKIIPFFKTPTNILKEAYGDRVFFVAPFTEKYKADIAAGGSRAQMARAKLFNGTMIYASAIALAASGKLTGAYSRDPEVRKAQVSAGMKEYSIVGENKDGTLSYHSYQRLEPFSYMLSIAADFNGVMDELQYQPFTEDDQSRAARLASAVVIATSNSTLNKSFMEGVQSFMEAATKGESSAAWEAASFVNAHIPFAGARRDIMNMLSDDKKSYKDAFEYAQEQITFWNNEAVNDVDILGNEMKRENLFAVWGESKAKKNAIMEENLHLTKLTKNKAIGQFPKSFKGAEFSKQDWHDGFIYSRKEARIDGKDFETTVQNMIESNFYDGQEPIYQVDILRKITRNFDKMGIQYLTDRSPDLDNKTKVYSFKKDIIAEASKTGRPQKEIEAEWIERIKNF